MHEAAWYHLSPGEGLPGKPHLRRSCVTHLLDEYKGFLYTQLGLIISPGGRNLRERLTDVGIWTGKGECHENNLW